MRQNPQTSPARRDNRGAHHALALVGLVGSLTAQLCFANGAHAQAQPEAQVLPEARPAQEKRDGLVPQTATQSAKAGMFLPLTMGPSTSSQRAFARGFGGYDTARKSARFESTVDATLYGPLAARVTVEYGERAGSLRPGGGLRVQALSQDKHWLDLTVAVLYRAEGFTEAEGEIEGVVALSRRVGRWGVFANLVYGQDPEGNERDGEVRLATLYDLGELQVGLDARVRIDLGAEGESRAGKKEEEAEFDAQTGALAMYSLGPVALLASAGFSGVLLHEDFLAGFVGLAGLGGSI
ncbi:MAG: hypothetical protein RLZZ450_4204 [Pseudomonadota bacterium]|jgi:hypothetical protein